MALHIGIIGTGWFSKVHGDNLAAMDGVQIKAVGGTSAAKAQALADRYPGAIGFGNLADMLDAQKLDAVYICVPPMAHGEIEAQLIERGIPFFVEKPLATDLDTPLSILNKLQQKPLIHAVGYHLRYRESIRKMKETLEGRTIGMALGTWMGDMPQVAWWRDLQGSGGQFVEQTTHIVDLLRYTAGEIEEVYAAFGSRLMHEVHDNVTVPDVGTVTMKLKNGAVATVSNTCILPGGVHEVGLHLYTDMGILDWKSQQLEVTAPDQKTTYHMQDDPYVAETEAFIHALRTGDTSRILSDYADAVETQRVTCAALESASTGQPVRLNP
ncbi:Gfo/Idh/MocA family protein [Paenibacillus senegalimassiliensis]|uniref:Gfo/Idh/MocA family protein n=1 Tax=Paenibacillus senegalimassiliensis TaxID=1737426 RepID=UPI00073EEF41|nr:Gfo/Idh/MocA family oxidoreductase [Paenibacillus senegalimassiliensis]